MFIRATVFLIAATIAPAATFTWDGSTNTWVSEKTNWQGNKAPGGNPDVVFNSTSALDVYFDFGNGATTIIDDMTFTSSAGAFTLSSDGTNVLKIGNVDNQSSETQVFDLALEFQNKETVIAGGPIQFNQAVTTKSGNSELTFAGDSQIIAGANNIFDGSIELFLNGTTLNLNDTNQSFSHITVIGDSSIDFGGSNASLNLDFLTVTDGTLTIYNWTGSAGDFAVANNVDQSTLDNVVFDGWGDANWDSSDGVTPGAVPEPSTYGAVLMGLSLGGWAWWRRRSRPRGQSSFDR